MNQGLKPLILINQSYKYCMKIDVKEEMSLMAALEKAYPESSKTTIRSFLKEGRVWVGQKPQKLANTTVYPGQTIQVLPRKRLEEDQLEIMFEDRHLVVVNKPSGLLSVATKFETAETAHGILKRTYKPKKVFVIHRLDQDTSGVMLFGLSEHSYEGLKKVFENHSIEREYYAIVEGVLEEPSGVWESYLYEDANYKVHQTDDPKKGEQAITYFEVLKTTRKWSLLKLRLKTGKKNQIRVHCQSAGHPIVGDKKYGATMNPIGRLALHAGLLEFKHPVTNKKMRFESKLPEEFSRLVKGIAKKI